MSLLITARRNQELERLQDIKANKSLAMGSPDTLRPRKLSV